MSFHQGSRHTTGRDQADRASDLSSNDSTRQYVVDDTRLSCERLRLQQPSTAACGFLLVSVEV
jgi:hypothetical protein